MKKEEFFERVEETEKILLSKLNLKNVLTDIELADFYVKFIPYLKHSRKDDIGGRTTNSLSIYIDNYISFCNIIKLNDKEIIDSIKSFPSIIHTSNNNDFYNKYLLLGVIENESNTLRKDKLITKPRDYEISFDTLYSRYMLMNDLKYIPNWNNLVHASNNEFANIFIKSGYFKAYKKFNSIEEVNNALEKYTVSDDFISFLKTIPSNKELIGEKTNGK